MQNMAAQAAACQATCVEGFEHDRIACSVPCKLMPLAVSVRSGPTAAVEWELGWTCFKKLSRINKGCMRKTSLKLSELCAINLPVAYRSCLA